MSGNLFLLYNPNQPLPDGNIRILNEMGEGAKLPTGENWPYRLYFYLFKQHTSYQGTLGTLELILIGSRTNRGPSMDPTGKFLAMYTFSTLYTL